MGESISSIAMNRMRRECLRVLPVENTADSQSGEYTNAIVRILPRHPRSDPSHPIHRECVGAVTPVT
jgi:hypothetical protein